MTDYEVNESAMRDGVPEPDGYRTCLYCSHWHPAASGCGVCDAGWGALPAWNADVAAESVTDEDATCGEWRECE